MENVTAKMISEWVQGSALDRETRTRARGGVFSFQLREYQPTTGVTLTVAAGYNRDLELAIADAFSQLERLGR